MELTYLPVGQDNRNISESYFKRIAMKENISVLLEFTLNIALLQFE